ncbi:5-formyltetrahydrofolate cyclo-ligase isoform 2-T2 [Syngnathus typhle]
MAAMRAAKQALRKEIKRRVALLSEEEKHRQSLIVCQKLIRHPKYLACKRIAVFLSMDDEVHTEEIIKDMFKLNSMQDTATLSKTSWNILQPSEDDKGREEALSAGGLDLILMPGLGFDLSGKRLGRGKGFYDTYLARCFQHPKGKPYTIALAYKEQLCQDIPVDNNDVLIDEVLYEDGN